MPPKNNTYECIMRLKYSKDRVMFFFGMIIFSVSAVWYINILFLAYLLKNEHGRHFQTSSYTSSGIIANTSIHNSTTTTKFHIVFSTSCYSLQSCTYLQKKVQNVLGCVFVHSFPGIPQGTGLMNRALVAPCG